MSYIIGLTSARANGVNMVYIQASELEHETLFALERSIRSSVKSNPNAEWSDLLENLEKDGFTMVLQPRNNSIFVHSRPWDEHHISKSTSFFVTFGQDSPYELAGEIFLATPRPHYYSTVCADYVGEDRVLILTKEHEPIYSDDMAWKNPTHAEKGSLGSVVLIREQFCCEDEIQSATRLLAASGYKVLCEELV